MPAVTVPGDRYPEGSAMTTILAPKSDNLHLNRVRWRHLTLGVVCMLMIANLQYGWTLFVLPLQRAHGWAIAEIQFAFTLFVALETWGTPLPGWIADKLGPDIGPRVAISAGGVLVAVGWIVASWADSLPLLYLGGDRCQEADNLQLQHARDAAYASVLGSLYVGSHDVRGRPDGDCESRADRAFLWRRQCDDMGHDGAVRGADLCQHHERRRPAAFRLGGRSGRQHSRHGDRVRPWCREDRKSVV